MVEMLGIPCSSDHLRKVARGVYEAHEYYSQNAVGADSNNQVNELKQERYKIQTEKLEYNRWLRESARDDLIAEHICQAISALEPLDIPPLRQKYYNSRAGVLLFGDEHYGVEFGIPGLDGEIINAYSPEIFERRMWDLLDETVAIVEREGFDEIEVFSMGDFQDGVLRVGQLWKLRYGVVEGTVKYAQFITNWLNELTKHVRVNYQMTRGNHTELRMLGQPKGTFKDDNMSRVVEAWVEDRLADNPNFTFTQNPTGLIYTKIFDYNVAGIHGEVKKMSQAIKDFSNTYKVQIDYFISGHKHHAYKEEVGINREVLGVPSIMGSENFSMSINKTASAGATFVIFEDGKGKTVEYAIKLR